MVLTAVIASGVAATTALVLVSVSAGYGTSAAGIVWFAVGGIALCVGLAMVARLKLRARRELAVLAAVPAVTSAVSAPTV
jgi:hypothetical protein